MMVAQRLYEGVELGSEGAVALITYMRTDSTRISDDALKACREHIGKQYGHRTYRHSRTGTPPARVPRKRTKRSARPIWPTHRSASRICCRPISSGSTR